MSASTRMNRYELAKRTPDFGLVDRISEVLNVPTAYLFAEDDQLAELILKFSEMKATAQMDNFEK